MKSRNQRHAGKHSTKKTREENPAPALALPKLTELLKGGCILIETLASVCVATASDDEINYATLVRRRGESLLQLLVRLDQAVDNAMTLGIFTDQLNR